MTTSSRQVHLARRPVGLPSAADVELRAVELPPPGPGQVLVRNLVMSVDPYMRLKMAGVAQYPSWEVGGPLDGSAIAVVTDAADSGLEVGSLVGHRLGWREYAIVDATDLEPIRPRPGVPVSAHLGVLGMTGLTAYLALTAIADLRAGESVYVSAAAGAVGGAAGQMARILGAGQVVGSAGSSAKVAHLIDDLGFDAGFDYHEDLRGSLARACGRGIDVYVDNVGGGHLAAVLDQMNRGGRVAVSGAISQYDGRDEPAEAVGLMQVLTKRLRLEGFNVRDRVSEYAAFVDRAATWLVEGRLTHRETVVDGLEHAVAALADVLRGRSVGKMVVHLADDGGADQAAT